jgi:hypothetical protein
MQPSALGNGGDPPRMGRRIVRRPTPAPPEPTPEHYVGDPRLLRPAVTCPRCGARPALRVTREIVAALAGTPAVTCVGSYQCQRRGCGDVYPITADAYHRAS